MWKVFESCATAVQSEIPTHRPRDDKEFHFQRWVALRMGEVNISVPEGGRNTYPDFPVEGYGEAYEVKGITAGSREGDFDCNSALPSGEHNGMEVLYVFGRYENERDGGDSPKVLDLVIVHGSLLNAGGDYIADNKSMRVLGSYGDVLLRDRKMYVAYTPYRLLTNILGFTTIVLPKDWPERPSSFQKVGDVKRREADEILVGYEADLRANSLSGRFEPNHSAGKIHEFEAWTFEDDRAADAVELRQ